MSKKKSNDVSTNQKVTGLPDKPTVDKNDPSTQAITKPAQQGGMQLGNFKIQSGIFNLKQIMDKLYTNLQDMYVLLLLHHFKESLV